MISDEKIEKINKLWSDKVAEQKNRYDTQMLLYKEEEKYQSIKKNIELHKTAYSQLEKIIEESNRKYINKIEKLLNKAIKTIFYDEDYAIKVIVDNKKLNFMLLDMNNKDDNNEPLEVDIDDACGGGIITVIGFVLQLFIIEILKLNKTIFVDEGFMALSETYRPLFYDFINEFCKNTNMKILLISHDELVREKAIKEITIEHGTIGGKEWKSLE